MTATPAPNRLLAWYGDDFTGAAAVMEAMAFAGVSSVLFLDRPTPQDLADFPAAEAIGIAGSARAQTPDWMARELPAVFASLKSMRADLTLYKICSTLDSSPDIGSIGCAVDLALQVFAPTLVPVMPAAPPIGRWQAFGTLFARAGTGIHRLDRHPVMQQHPVTPMTEADVARHLSAQTDQPIGCLMLTDLAAPDGGAAALAAMERAGTRLVTLDCTTEADLARIGALLWQRRGPEAFVAGSQGVAYALTRHLVATGQLPPPAPSPVRTDPVDRIAVVSGSVSAVT
ncbi:MAG: four-carbon acid sugar kinase family protein [Tabrizicola sp.]